MEGSFMKRLVYNILKEIRLLINDYKHRNSFDYIAVFGNLDNSIGFDNPKYYHICRRRYPNNSYVNREYIAGIKFLDVEKSNITKSKKPLLLNDTNIELPKLKIIGRNLSPLYENEYEYETTFKNWTGSAPNLEMVEGRKFSWKKQL